jgi:DNA-binding CsgD family transcriptional regulator
MRERRPSEALRSELTRREAELVWLCTMVLPRARVAEFFGGGEENFRSHVRTARKKLGAASFEEIGRIALE